MLRSKRKSKSPYARPNAHPALRALNPATTATQTQAGPSRPTQAAVQFVSTQPQNQEHQLPVDDPTTSEQTAVPLPSIAPSIPLSTSGENPLISISDELGVHVPQTIKDKIWSKQYIDLSKIINSETVDTSAQDSHKFSIVEGQLVIEPKTKTNKITSINTWLDAFLIFSSIYLARHPSDIQGILKYIHTIRLGYSRNINGNWIEYDRQFPLKMSKNTSISFGSIDAELWLLYMHAQVQQTPQQSKSSLKCFDYNFKGSCPKPQCSFQHICMHCNKSHPRMHCWSYQSTQTQVIRSPPPNPAHQNFAPQNYTNFRPLRPRHYQLPRPRFHAPRFNPN